MVTGPHRVKKADVRGLWAEAKSLKSNDKAGTPLEATDKSGGG